MLLTRSVKGKTARLRGLVLLKGDESKANWKEAFKESLEEREMKQIKAIVADGSHGLTEISRKNDWKYQRCQFHLLKDLEHICGKRKGETQWIRQDVYKLVRANLDCPDEREANLLKRQLVQLIAHPDCPRTVRKKAGGFLRHYGKFRTCYHYPELNLPATSNSAEAAGRMVKDLWGRMRGARNSESLRCWLELLLRKNKFIKCEPKINNRIIKS